MHKHNRTDVLVNTKYMYMCEHLTRMRIFHGVVERFTRQMFEMFIIYMCTHIIVARERLVESVRRLIINLHHHISLRKTKTHTRHTFPLN